MSDLERRKKTTFLQAEGLRPMPKLQSGTNVTKRFKAIAFTVLMQTFAYNDDLYDSGPSRLARSLWVLYFSEYDDTIPRHEAGFGRHIKDYISKDANLLDVLQFTAREGWFSKESFSILSESLKSELIGYRFIGKHNNGEATLMPIADEEEAEANQQDYEKLTEFPSARIHFLQAIDEMKQSHFRGSVTESISAVESIIKSLSGNDKVSLGTGLNLLAREHELHPALKAGLEKIYGWTNSPNGMRHALSDESIPVTEADARFMLSACLAFSAWLKRSQAS